MYYCIYEQGACYDWNIKLNKKQPNDAASVTFMGSLNSIKADVNVNMIKYESTCEKVF